MPRFTPLLLALFVFVTGLPQLAAPWAVAGMAAHADDDGGGGGGDGRGDDSGGGDDDGSDDDSDDDGNDDDDDSDDDGSGNSGPGSSGTDTSAKALGDGALRRLGPAGTRRLLLDGSAERILGGTYERLDAQGRVTERRAATHADTARLRLMKGALAIVSLGRSRAVVIDNAGWREELTGTRYQLTDPRGNLVVRRRATAADLKRIQQILPGE